MLRGGSAAVTSGAALHRIIIVMTWLLTTVVSTGCGASMDALYEGDIFFEHCMALDAQPSVAANNQRACWSEWLAHYTYGQTQDRVRHAQGRVQQLGGPTVSTP